MKLHHKTLRSTKTISSVGTIDIDAEGFSEVTEAQGAHLLKCGFVLATEPAAPAPVTKMEPVPVVVKEEPMKPAPLPVPKPVEVPKPMPTGVPGPGVTKTKKKTK